MLHLNKFKFKIFFKNNLEVEFIWHINNLETYMSNLLKQKYILFDTKYCIFGKLDLLIYINILIYVLVYL